MPPLPPPHPKHTAVLALHGGHHHSDALHMGVWQGGPTTTSQGPLCACQHISRPEQGTERLSQEENNDKPIFILVCFLLFFIGILCILHHHGQATGGSHSAGIKVFGFISSSELRTNRRAKINQCESNESTTLRFYRSPHYSIFCY